MYSELKVLKSAAGYYIGREYTEDGFTEPGSRESDYFGHKKLAEIQLQNGFLWRDSPENVFLYKTEYYLTHGEGKYNWEDRTIVGFAKVFDANNKEYREVLWCNTLNGEIKFTGPNRVEMIAKVPAPLKVIFEPAPLKVTFEDEPDIFSKAYKIFTDEVNNLTLEEARMFIDGIFSITTNPIINFNLHEAAQYLKKKNQIEEINPRDREAFEFTINKLHEIETKIKEILSDA